MGELPLLTAQGARAGRLHWSQEGLYLRMEARTESRHEGIVRAYLRGEHGELLLGVMEPEGAGMVCRRRLAEPQLRRLGGLVGAVMRGSDDAPWQAYGGEIAGEWGRRLMREGTLLRREGERWLAALPYPVGAPFPFTELFCLAELIELEGRRYVLYAFTQEGNPTLRRQ